MEFKELKSKYIAFARDMRRLYGIFAYAQPFSCCNSCMWYDIDMHMARKRWDPTRTHNVLVFHEQSWDSAKEDFRLYISHRLDEDKKRYVLSGLTEHFGTNWSWDGSDNKNIIVWHAVQT